MMGNYLRMCSCNMNSFFKSIFDLNTILCLCLFFFCVCVCVAGETAVFDGSRSEHHFLGGIHHSRDWEVSPISIRVAVNRCRNIAFIKTNSFPNAVSFSHFNKPVSVFSELLISDESLCAKRARRTLKPPWL